MLLPSDFVPILKKSTITFAYLPVEFDSQPKVLASVLVDSNLQLKLHVLSAPVGLKCLGKCLTRTHHPGILFKHLVPVDE